MIIPTDYSHIDLYWNRWKSPVNCGEPVCHEFWMSFEGWQRWKGTMKLAKANHTDIITQGELPPCQLAAVVPGGGSWDEGQHTKPRWVVFFNKSNRSIGYPSLIHTHTKMIYFSAVPGMRRLKICMVSDFFHPGHETRPSAPSPAIKTGRCWEYTPTTEVSLLESHVYF